MRRWWGSPTTRFFGWTFKTRGALAFSRAFFSHFSMHEPRRIGICSWAQVIRITICEKRASVIHRRDEFTKHLALKNIFIFETLGQAQEKMTDLFLQRHGSIVHWLVTDKNLANMTVKIRNSKGNSTVLFLKTIHNSIKQSKGMNIHSAILGVDRSPFYIPKDWPEDVAGGWARKVEYITWRSSCWGVEHWSLWMGLTPGIGTDLPRKRPVPSSHEYSERGVQSKQPNHHLLCPRGFPEFMYFFCLARQFWNHTWVTRLLKPVIWAIRSRSWPSGLESIWKFACRIWICSSVKVVLIRFVFFLFWDSVSPLSAIWSKETTS